MRTPQLTSSSHNSEVADLLRSTRCMMKNSKKGNKSQYTARAVARKVGCSPTHYGRLEEGKREIANIKLIYGISLTLHIPLDILIQTYLGISKNEVQEHFTIVEEYKSNLDNTKFLKLARKKLSESNGCKQTIRKIADNSGISATYYNRIELGENTFKDIRIIYPVSISLKIPMYVLIRNELGLTDTDMKNVISHYSTEHIVNENYTEFVQKIVEAREKSGMSQRELARKWNVSNASWARWERGEIKPSDVETIFMISEALHLNFFELIAVLYPEIKEKYQKEFEIIRIMGK